MSLNSAISTETELDQTFDRLYDIMRSEPFQSSTGIGNEVPLYIQPYPIAAQNTVEKRVKALHSRLATAGQEVLSINLLELVFEITSEGNRLKRLLEQESSYSRQKALSTMVRWTDPKTVIVPAMRQKMNAVNYDTVLVHGCGSVFPFLRTHFILENFQVDMEKNPIVFFFPGEYQHRDASGSDLRLFGCLSHKGYYRAFNLDHYHL